MRRFGCSAGLSDEGSNLSTRNGHCFRAQISVQALIWFLLFDQKTYNVVQVLPHMPYGGSCTGYPQVAPQELCASVKTLHNANMALFQLAIYTGKPLFYIEKESKLSKLIVF